MLKLTSVHNPKERSSRAQSLLRRQPISTRLRLSSWWSNWLSHLRQSCSRICRRKHFKKSLRPSSLRLCNSCQALSIRESFTKATHKASTRILTTISSFRMVSSRTLWPAATPSFYQKIQMIIQSHSRICEDFSRDPNSKFDSLLSCESRAWVNESITLLNSNLK